MGRLSREKGFDILLDAFAEVAEMQPEWKLALFGEGPMRAAVGLTDRVTMPGLVKHAHDALAQADIFVLPSRFEGFPNALCEAMACSVAAIATDCPSGPREIIRHDVDGLLVPPDDSGALAREVARLMADPDARRRLGERATEVVERFSPEHVVRQWEEILADGDFLRHQSAYKDASSSVAEVSERCDDKETDLEERRGQIATYKAELQNMQRAQQDLKEEKSEAVADVASLPMFVFSIAPLSPTGKQYCLLVN